MDQRGAAPLPLQVSLTLLLALLAGGVVLALSLEPRTPKVEAAPEAVELTIVRDVLTGRYTDERGIPLPPPEGPGSAATPLRLRFVPSSDVAQDDPTVKRLLAFLARRTGYAIEGATLHSYGLVVQEIVQGKCDVAFLTAASYARARYATDNNDDPGDDIEAIVQVVRQGNPDYPGSDLAYRAAIIVRADSPLRSARDLTDEHVIALGNPTSGASSILPTALFTRLGVRPGIQRYEGYPIIVNAVLQGAVDAGSIWWSPPTEALPHNDARQLVAATNPDVFEKTRIIDLTPWIPNEPVVVRKALPADVKRTMARALSLYASLLTLSEEGRKELVAVGSPVGFIPATNDDFVPLMEVIQLAFANDPEGRADFMKGSK